MYKSSYRVRIRFYSLRLFSTSCIERAIPMIVVSKLELCIPFYRGQRVYEDVVCMI
jgi:hypothetical protein